MRCACGFETIVQEILMHDCLKAEDMGSFFFGTFFILYLQFWARVPLLALLLYSYPALPLLLWPISTLFPNKSILLPDC